MRKKIFLFVLMAFSLFTKAQQGAEILIQANRATLERNFDEAIRLYGQFIKLNPTDFRGYFNRGTTEYNAARYDDAVRDFTQTLSLNPIYKEAYYFRGLCYVEQKKYSLALVDYNKILDKDPGNVSFLKLRSDAYIGQGQNDLALKDLDLALSVDKLSGDLYKRRAEIKVVIKDFEGAIKDYNSVQKLIPTYKMVHYIKGNLYMELNDLDFACDEYKLALANNVIVAERVFESKCQ
jgi:tetratricopeptide (TPR) repeat protein